jgi:steroid delta-isomerase-like uncharacterized protein
MVVSIRPVKGNITMASETNKAIVRRIFEEGFNQKNTGILDELIASNYVNYDFPMPVPGREGFKQIAAMFLSAFPDQQVVVELQVAEGDKVANHGYWTGTHHGDFLGIPATGKTVRVSFIDIWRVENDQAVENWVQQDIAGLMQQLGVAG